MIHSQIVTKNQIDNSFFHKKDTLTESVMNKAVKILTAFLLVLFMKILYCSSFIFIIALCVYHFDIQINTTSSIPIGIYTLDRSKDNLDKARTILFCLNNEYSEIAKTRGYLPVGKCKSGLSPIGKHIVAAADDFVEITKEGIYVNGYLLPDTRPMTYDSNSLELKHSKLKRRLNKNEFLVASLKKDSFDSRYYGIVKREEILGVLKELVVI